MSQIGQLAQNAKHIAQAKAPQILTAMAVAGVVGTVVLAVKVTPKAAQMINDEEVHRAEFLKPIEKVKLCWLLYTPAAASGVLTITCMIMANSLNVKRQAAVMSLYTVTEKALADYKDKVVETVGEKAEEKVRDAVAQERVTRDEPVEAHIVETGNGNTLIRDEYSGRYFRSSMEALRKAENDLNFQILGHDTANLNELYSILGLEPTKVGDTLGWNTDNKLEMDITAAINGAGEPVLVLDFRANPAPNFYKFGR